MYKSSMTSVLIATLVLGLCSCASKSQNNNVSGLKGLAINSLINNDVHQAEIELNIISELQNKNIITAKEIIEVSLDFKVLELVKLYEKANEQNRKDIQNVLLKIKKYRQDFTRQMEIHESYGEYAEEIQEKKREAQLILDQIGKRYLTN